MSRLILAAESNSHCDTGYAKLELFAVSTPMAGGRIFYCRQARIGLLCILAGPLPMNEAVSVFHHDDFILFQHR